MATVKAASRTSQKRQAKLDAMTERELIDALAGSISRLCHQVIARRLEQFFEVIHEEIAKAEGR